ncbi:hypothetical protein [Algirhabdus cladophorae]|uniref:hypothetical protein n=1 Tax=Algirhabdus cladophorae TaxID=3377108 RepID=UPI003B84AAF1
MDTNISAARAFIKNSVLPDTFFAKLSILLASISMLSLLVHAVEYGLSDTFTLLLDWYETLLNKVLGWLGAILVFALELISRLISINISLQPHWQHVFVLMNIYFLRDALFYRTSKHLNVNRSNWHLTLGLLLAVLASCASGSINDDGTSLISSILVAVFPVSGILIYDLVERHWFVRHYAKADEFTQHGISNRQAAKFYRQKILERAVGLLLSSVITVLISRNWIGLGEGVGIIALLVSMLLISIYWISGRASLYYQFVGSKDDSSPFLYKLLFRSGTSELGSIMLGTFFWLAVFLVFNAGLGLSGL